MTASERGSRWYSLHLFDRGGTCLYQKEWNSIEEGSVRNVSTKDKKLIFGLLYSIKSFSSALQPIQASSDERRDASVPASSKTCSFRSFRTDTYKLHYMESPTGVRIVLMTDPNAGDYGDTLRYIYRAIYLEYVVKNPLYVPGQPLDCPYFVSALEKYAKTMGAC